MKISQSSFPRTLEGSKDVIPPPPNYLDLDHSGNATGRSFFLWNGAFPKTWRKKTGLILGSGCVGEHYLAGVSRGKPRVFDGVGWVVFVGFDQDFTSVSPFHSSIFLRLFC